MVKIQLSVELVTQMLTTGWDSEHRALCTLGLPVGAILERVALVSMGGSIGYTQIVELYFSHPTFGELQPSDEIPVFTPEFGAVHE